MLGNLIFGFVFPGVRDWGQARGCCYSFELVLKLVNFFQRILDRTHRGRHEVPGWFNRESVVAVL